MRGHQPGDDPVQQVRRSPEGVRLRRVLGQGLCQHRHGARRLPLQGKADQGTCVHLTQGAVLLSGVDIWKYIFQVMPKRTNKPGLCITNRPPRGRGFRGRGRGASMRGFGAMRRPRYVDGREKSLIISLSGRSSM